MCSFKYCWHAFWCCLTRVDMEKECVWVWASLWFNSAITSVTIDTCFSLKSTSIINTMSALPVHFNDGEMPAVWEPWSMVSEHVPQWHTSHLVCECHPLCVFFCTLTSRDCAIMALQVTEMQLAPTGKWKLLSDVWSCQAIKTKIMNGNGKLKNSMTDMRENPYKYIFQFTLLSTVCEQRWLIYYFFLFFKPIVWVCVWVKDLNNLWNI